MIKIHALFSQLLLRGHAGVTYFKIKKALDGDKESMSPQEISALKKLLTEISVQLTKTINRL